jgi:hypothetical protein
VVSPWASSTAQRGAPPKRGQGSSCRASEAAKCPGSPLPGVRGNDLPMGFPMYRSLAFSVPVYEMKSGAGWTPERHVCVAAGASANQAWTFMPVFGHR